MPICLPSSGDPAFAFDPLTQTCPGVVAVAPSDVPVNPFVLSIEDGAIVSSAVAGVWLLAWSFKAVRSVLHDRDET